MDSNETRQVNIVDIKMPFWSMVVFMVKANQWGNPLADSVQQPA